MQETKGMRNSFDISFPSLLDEGCVRLDFSERESNKRRRKRDDATKFIHK